MKLETSRVVERQYDCPRMCTRRHDGNEFRNSARLSRPRKGVQRLDPKLPGRNTRGQEIERPAMLAWLRKHPELECQLIPSCWHRGLCAHANFAWPRRASQRRSFRKGDKQLSIIRSRASRFSARANYRLPPRGS